MFQHLSYILKAILLIVFLPTSPLFGATPSAEVKELQDQLEQTDDQQEKVDLSLQIYRKLIYADVKLAEAYAQDAMNLATEIDYHKGIAEAFRAYATLNVTKGNQEKALAYYNKALKMAQKHKIQETEANSYMDIGYHWYRTGDSAKTLNYYHKGLKLHTALKREKSIIAAHMRLGWGYSYFGDFEQAKFHFTKAVEESRLFPDTTLNINALHGLAAFYINTSTNQNEALQYLQEALELAKQSNKPYHIAKIYKAIGVLYTNMGQFESAKAFYIDGLDLFEQIDYDTELCWIYRAIGELSTDLGDYDEALQYFEQALAVVDQTSNKEYQSGLLFRGIGNVYLKRDKDYVKAIGYFKRALKNAEERDDINLMTHSKMLIGSSYVAMGQYEEGRSWCAEAERTSDDFLQVLQPTCECLYQANLKLGNYKSSLEYHEKFKTLTDSIHQQELSKEISSLAAKKEYEKELATLKKDQEIEVEKARTRNTILIGIISFIALLIIMWLVTSNVKKTAQKEQILALANLRKELVANISHDLRTPITVMKGFIETLQMKINTVSKADKERYLSVLLSNTEKLSAMISQLFEYSKLEAKQIKPNKEPFQIKELAKDVVSDFKFIAEKKGVSIHLDCSEQVFTVFADINLIERVMQNLINNALKFTPENGKITVCLKEKNDSVEIEISDTGKGIPEEDQALIFERYQKGKSSTGAGLGLTIVKKILELHNGSIRVKSQLNQGASFIFSLPTYA